MFLGSLAQSVAPAPDAAAPEVRPRQDQGPPVRPVQLRHLGEGKPQVPRGAHPPEGGGVSLRGVRLHGVAQQGGQFKRFGPHFCPIELGTELQGYRYL